MHNMFENIPTDLTHEHFLDLLNTPNVRIERILSKGHSSPELGWYDQEQDEWVLVLQGEGSLVFADAQAVTMNVGDFLHIPAHTLHKVNHPKPDVLTLWLAIFFQPADSS